jgi:hypothetical protein
MPALDELIQRLRDHENEGVTASDRFHLREEAAQAIERLKHIEDKARQTGSVPYGWYAAMAEHVDELSKRRR